MSESHAKAVNGADVRILGEPNGRRGSLQTLHVKLSDVRRLTETLHVIACASKLTIRAKSKEFLPCSSVKVSPTVAPCCVRWKSELRRWQH